MTNSSNSNLIPFEFQQLCGISGWLRYKEYAQEFSGHFDGERQPILGRREFISRVPIVRPHPGQYLSGRWLDHESLPYVVLDTGILKAALPTSSALARPGRDLPYFYAGLAVEVESAGPEPVFAWQIFEVRRDEYNDEYLLCVTPEVKPKVAERIVCPPPLQLPLEQAVTFLKEEIGISKDQQTAINPELTDELPLMEAMTQAVYGVLGRDFRIVVDQAHLYEPKPLRLLERVQYMFNPGCVRLRQIEIITQLSPQRAFVLSQLQLMEKHPSLEQLIEDRADELMIRNRGLASVRRQRERTLADCLARVAQTEAPVTTRQGIPENVVPGLTPSQAPRSEPGAPRQVRRPPSRGPKMKL